MSLARLLPLGLACCAWAVSARADELPTIGSGLLPEWAVPHELVDVDGDGQLDLVGHGSGVTP